jgi:hypothetical protein
VPEHPQQNAGASRRKEQSRREVIEEKGAVPELPELECGGYLVGYLFEIGPTVPAGMGAGPISFEEIRAWQELTGISLNPWEARTLRRLSNDYLSESYNATKPDRPAPWKPEDMEPVDLLATARDLEMAMLKLVEM